MARRVNPRARNPTWRCQTITSLLSEAIILNLPNLFSKKTGAANLKRDAQYTEVIAKLCGGTDYSAYIPPQAVKYGLLAHHTGSFAITSKDTSPPVGSDLDLN